MLSVLKKKQSHVQSLNDCSSSRDYKDKSQLV